MIEKILEERVLKELEGLRYYETLLDGDLYFICEELVYEYSDHEINIVGFLEKLYNRIYLKGV